MRRKHLFLAIAALLAAGGLWFGRTAWRTHGFNKSSTDVGSKSSTDVGSKSSTGVGFETPNGGPTPGQMLRPPDPSRRFTDFSPEQRVQQARKGHGPGG